MVLQYHDGMTVPYEEGGRRRQKARTRAALLDAARRILAAGHTPSVERAAAEAGVSRTAAYRYFRSQTELVLAAHPEVGQETVLPDPAPSDVRERVGLVLDTHLRTLLEWEPQLRATLRVALDPAGTPGSLPLRQGRVITWLTDALRPLAETHPGLDAHRLAVAIRSATGIESLVWLVDVAHVPRHDAVQLLRGNGLAILDAAL